MVLSKSCLPGNQGCAPQSASKGKVVDDDDNEANLADRNLNSLEEIPRICKCFSNFFLSHLVGLRISKLLN